MVTTQKQTKTKKAVKAKIETNAKDTALIKTPNTEQVGGTPRIPVIAVMGHVDHGKTSILDAIRGTHVQEKEAGGITQNTRAHLVTTKNGQKLTFIDTPGHEAFSGMRSRGAKVTDIVMLVVAADDGVQPQTVESIKFAQEAKVPIVVAVNKMDLPGASTDKIIQELSSHNVLVEKFGGDVLIVEVSAKKKTGLDELLDTLLLQAEMLELKTTKLEFGKAYGVVLEATVSDKLGPAALVLIKAGSIEADDYMIWGEENGKIRKVLDENQVSIEKASEGMPVWIIGISKILKTGEKVLFMETEKESKEYLKGLKEKGEVEKVIVEDENVASEEEGTAEGGLSEDDSALFAALLNQDDKKEDVKKLNVIVKTDTQGTLEAVTEQLNALSDAEVEVNIIESSTGDITMNEVELAKDARAIILGFQVGIADKVEKVAKREKVFFKTYKIIYELIDEVDSAMTSLVEPLEEEVEVARAKVKKVFVLSNGQKVAGSEVVKGLVLKGYAVYVERPVASNKKSAEEIGRGKITSLKQNKQEVREMKKGQECGILIQPEVDVQEGDEIVCYKVEKL